MKIAPLPAVTARRGSVRRCLAALAGLASVLDAGAVLAQSAPAPSEEQLGYIPGSRQYQSLGLSPYAPTAGTLPGGVTPAFGAPSPSNEWNFTFAGYMSATLMASRGERRNVSSGQSEGAWNVPGRTAEEWASFTSTSPVQTNWVNLKFLYGTQNVTAQVSVDTWNPSRPTTFYQFGSQYFINQGFLRFRLPPIEGARLLWNVGYFSAAYGNLGRYGGGIYTNALAGLVQGVGETLHAEYDLSDTLIIEVEHGIQGPRAGKAPNEVAPVGSNLSANPNWVAAFTHHAHAGIVRKGEVTLQAQLHYLMNWSQDDRSRREVDVPTTDAIDERHPKDGTVSVYGADVRAIHPVFGYLAAGAAYVVADHAYPLKGLTTYGGEGDRLTSAWFGEDSGGSGKLLVAGVNYGGSIGRIVTYPAPFPSNHADLQIDAGLHVAKSWSDSEPFDRLRHKYGANALYTPLSWFGAGVRIDRVVPNSRDSEETFHVIAPRLQFKTDWNSHETISLHYVKWFYGAHTRGDNLVPRYQLDDQLVALNFNMWW